MVVSLPPLSGCVSGYRVYYSGETSGSVSTAGDQSVVISGLVCGSQYSFTAQALVEGCTGSENSTEMTLTTGEYIL